MEAREHLRIMKGVEVFDAADRRIGKVSYIDQPVAASELQAAGGVFEVKTGVLGLGPRYRIPVSAVKDVTAGGVFVGKTKDQFAALGWRKRSG